VKASIARLIQLRLESSSAGLALHWRIGVARFRSYLLIALSLAVVTSNCASTEPQQNQMDPLPEFVLNTLLPADGQEPAPEFAGVRNQFLPMVGRDDLIDPQPGRSVCTAATRDGADIEPVTEIARRAENSQIVIVNEAHDSPQDRAFIADVATALRPLGFDTYAAETLFPPQMTTPAAWPQMGDGFYSIEPAYGQLLRRVRSLGYRLVSYDEMSEDSSGDEYAQIARREQAQTDNLIARIFRDTPNAKVLIHVGYSHARETPEELSDGREQRWMALRLKEVLGIDPLTINQTAFFAEGERHVLCARSERGPIGQSMDLFVGTPRLNFSEGRARWSLLRGYRQVQVPRALASQAAPMIVVAHFAGEPDSAVPADRLLVRPGEQLPLLLLPGRYRVASWKRSEGWSRSVSIVVR